MKRLRLGKKASLVRERDNYVKLESQLLGKPFPGEENCLAGYNGQEVNSG